MKTSFAFTVLVVCAVWGFGVVPAVQPGAQAAALFMPRSTQSASADYGFLEALKLPWQQGDTEPRILTQDWRDHNVIGFALDFGHPQGGAYLQDTDLLAPMAGTVTKGTDPGTGYGNWVKIDADNGWQVLLAHMAAPSPVSNGVRVRTGQVVGRVGNSGNVPFHIHVEVRLNDAMPDVNRIERIFGRPRDDFLYPSAELWTSTNTNPYICTGDGIYVYERTNYDDAGRCVKLTNDEPSLANLMFDDMAASVRFVGSYASGWELVLHEHENSAKNDGASSTFRSDDPDLGNDAIGNGRASSAEVHRIAPGGNESYLAMVGYSDLARAMSVAK